MDQEEWAFILDDACFKMGTENPLEARTGYCALARASHPADDAFCEACLADKFLRITS